MENQRLEIDQISCARMAEIEATAKALLDDALRRYSGELRSPYMIALDDAINAERRSHGAPVSEEK